GALAAGVRRVRGVRACLAVVALELALPEADCGPVDVLQVAVRAEDDVPGAAAAQRPFLLDIHGSRLCGGVPLELRLPVVGVARAVRWRSGLQEFPPRTPSEAAPAGRRPSPRGGLPSARSRSRRGGRGAGGGSRRG